MLTVCKEHVVAVLHECTVLLHTSIHAYLHCSSASTIIQYHTHVHTLYAHVYVYTCTHVYTHAHRWQSMLCCLSTGLKARMVWLTWPGVESTKFIYYSLLRTHSGACLHDIPYMVECFTETMQTWCCTCHPLTLTSPGSQWLLAHNCEDQQGEVPFECICQNCSSMTFAVWHSVCW